MADQWVTEKEFFAQLHKREFEPTGFIDADLRVWSHKGKPYIIPQIVAANSEQGFYSPDDVKRFFDNAFLDQALDDPSDERFYNVEKIKPRH